MKNNWQSLPSSQSDLSLIFSKHKDKYQLRIFLKPSLTNDWEKVSLAYDLNDSKILISPNLENFKSRKLHTLSSNYKVIIQTFKRLPDFFKSFSHKRKEVPFDITEEGVIIDVSAFR